MNKQDILALFDYHEWAYSEMLTALAPLTAEQFLRDLGNSFPSVHDTAAHILAADWVWLERWKGRPTGALPAAADTPTVVSLRARAAAITGDRRAFLEGLSEERLHQPFTYKDSQGNPRSLLYVQSMQHVVNHATYHRGQLTTLLRQLGAKPVSTDLSRFLYERGVR
jgi:uncharacterized damage-inducible protein DinB